MYVLDNHQHRLTRGQTVDAPEQRRKRFFLALRWRELGDALSGFVGQGQEIGNKCHVPGDISTRHTQYFFKLA